MNSLSNYGVRSSVDWAPSWEPSHFDRGFHSESDLILLVAAVFFMFIAFPAFVVIVDRVIPYPVGNHQERLVINRSKIVPFDVMLAPFSRIKIDSLVEYWDRSLVDEELKLPLREYFLLIDDSQETASARKVKGYLTILFNILLHYEQLETDKDYCIKKEKEVLKEVLKTFEEGCDYNQLSNLKTIISESIDLHPDLAAISSYAPLDFLFALAINKYQISLIREKIQEAALAEIQEVKELKRVSIMRSGCYHSVFGVGGLEGLGIKEVARRLGVREEDLATRGIKSIVGPLRGQIGFLEAERLIGKNDVERFGIRALGFDSIHREGVELEFVVMKKLGFTQDEFQAHYFENDSPVVQRVADAVKRTYELKKFLLRELTAPFVTPILRKFHTDIAVWYRREGFDPYENKTLLMNQRAEEYQLWFNAKAIHYFMVKNKFFIEERGDNDYF